VGASRRLRAAIVMCEGKWRIASFFPSPGIHAWDEAPRASRRRVGNRSSPENKPVVSGLSTNGSRHENGVAAGRSPGVNAWAREMFAPQRGRFETAIAPGSQVVGQFDFGCLWSNEVSPQTLAKLGVRCAQPQAPNPGNSD